MLGVVKKLLLNIIIPHDCDEKIFDYLVLKITEETNFPLVNSTRCRSVLPFSFSFATERKNYNDKFFSSNFHQELSNQPQKFLVVRL